MVGTVTVVAVMVVVVVVEAIRYNGMLFLASVFDYFVTFHLLLVIRQDPLLTAIIRYYKQ